MKATLHIASHNNNTLHRYLGSVSEGTLDAATAGGALADTGFSRPTKDVGWEFPPGGDFSPP